MTITNCYGHQEAIVSGKLAHKAVKEAAGVGDSSVLTGSLVPQIALSQYKPSYTDKQKKDLKNRTLLYACGTCQRTQLSSITLCHIPLGQGFTEAGAH